MPELALHRGDVARLLHDVLAHGVAGRVRRLILNAGDLQDFVPHIVDDLWSQTPVPVRVSEGREEERRATPLLIVLRPLPLDVVPDRLQTFVTDLVGVLETLFSRRADGGTRIVYHWYVRVHHPVLNVLGLVFAPLFQASHDQVMREGEAGLQRYCRERIGGPSENKTF